MRRARGGRSSRGRLGDAAHQGPEPGARPLAVWGKVFSFTRWLFPSAEEQALASKGNRPVSLLLGVTCDRGWPVTPVSGRHPARPGHRSPSALGWSGLGAPRTARHRRDSGSWGPCGGLSLKSHLAESPVPPSRGPPLGVEPHEWYHKHRHGLCELEVPALKARHRLSSRAARR